MSDKRLEEIRALADELKYGTLHGPVPIKTTMRLVEDIDYLFSLLDQQPQGAQPTPAEATGADYRLISPPSAGVGLVSLCICRMRDNRVIEEGCGHDVLAVYNARFRTNKGEVLEYRNDSNGYYGGYLVD